MIKRFMFVWTILFTIFQLIDPALALSVSQRNNIVVANYPWKPAWQCDLLANTLCSGLSNSSPSLGSLITDTSGLDTYKPNNLLQNTSTLNISPWVRVNMNLTSGVADPFGGNNAWTMTATAGGGTAYLRQNPVASPYTLSCVWVKTRSLSGIFSMRSPGGGQITIGINGTWQQKCLNSTNTAGGTSFALYLNTDTDAVDIYAPTVSAVTYETKPRPGDQVITTSAAAYYGPAFSNSIVTTKGNNLVTYSNKFDDASWSNTTMTVTSGVSDPFGGNNAWTITANGANSAIFKYLGATPNQNLISSVWIKARNVTGSIQLRKPSGTGNVIVPTGTWQQFYIKELTASNIYFWIDITTSGNSIDIYAATLSNVTTETTPRSQDQVINTSSPYFEDGNGYLTYVTQPQGLRIWEQRSNFLIQSQFAASWTAGGSTLGSNSTISPTNTNNAFSLTEDTSTGGHYLTSAAVSKAASAITYTLSLYVKPKGSVNRRVLLQAYNSSNGVYTVFNLSGNGSNPVISTTYGTGFTSGTTNITLLQNGWLRISLTFTSDATTNLYSMIQIDNGSGASYSTSYTGDGTSGFYIWGAQLEQASFAGPYIPTNTAAVTAAADVVTLPTIANSVLISSKGSVLVELFNILSPVSNYPRIVSGGTNNGMFIDTTNKAGFFNGTTPLLSTNTATWTQANRFGVTFGISSRSIVLNGTGFNKDNLVPNWPSTSTLGSTGSTYFSNGIIRSLSVYSKILPTSLFQRKSLTGANY